MLAFLLPLPRDGRGEGSRRPRTPPPLPPPPGHRPQSHLTTFPLDNLEQTWNKSGVESAPGQRRLGGTLLRKKPGGTGIRPAGLKAEQGDRREVIRDRRSSAPKRKRRNNGGPSGRWKGTADRRGFVPADWHEGAAPRQRRRTRQEALSRPDSRCQPFRTRRPTAQASPLPGCGRRATAPRMGGSRDTPRFSSKSLDAFDVIELNTKSSSPGCQWQGRAGRSFPPVSPEAPPPRAACARASSRRMRAPPHIIPVQAGISGRKARAPVTRADRGCLPGSPRLSSLSSRRAVQTGPAPLSPPLPSITPRAKRSSATG